MSSQAPDRIRRAPRRAPSREEIVTISIVAILGLVWGALWKRSAALVEVSSFLPILLLLVGPGVLVVFLAYRGATGSLQSRIVGYATGAALIGALVGNLLTPAVPSSVEVGGHVTGALDGGALDQPGACTWGPGRTAVIRVTTPLPDRSTPGSGIGSGYFSKGIPSGTLVIELPSGSVSVQDIPQDLGLNAMPLRNGTGGVGEGDRASGSITLVAAQGAAVDGALQWTCDAAPAS